MRFFYECNKAKGLATVMDNKANIILSSVISNHGNQLLTSNAFCKVYLSGYLADYPQEKQLLIALKEQEIPKAFLDFKENRITEVELQNFINASSKNSALDHTAIAWGVDAWASAVGLSQPVKLNLLRQCFGYSDPILDFTILPPQSTSTEAQQKSPAKWGSALAKTAVAASLAVIVWMIPSQESDNYASLETQAPTTLKTAEVNTLELKPQAIKKVLTDRIGATEMLGQTLAKSKQLNEEEAPKPMVIGQSKARTLKTRQLRADIDAYLQSGPKAN